jgi:hypothetical protein
MRARLGLLACVVFVGLVVFGTYEPRLHHTFPSMVDDWSAILKAPDQLQAVLRLENPEEQRYRPGFIAWNARRCSCPPDRVTELPHAPTPARSVEHPAGERQHLRPRVGRHDREADRLEAGRALTSFPT